MLLLLCSNVILKMSTYSELSQKDHNMIIILMLNDSDKIFRYYDAVYSQSRGFYIIEVTQH